MKSQTKKEKYHQSNEEINDIDCIKLLIFYH